MPGQITESDLREISVHNFDPTLSSQQKAYYYYLRGRLFNVFDGYNQSAEDNLCKAVKLNPRFVQAWKELGECFWKKGDLDASENCFRWILDLDNSKLFALARLAMVTRRKQCGTTQSSKGCSNFRSRWAEQEHCIM